jgi:hypothetical protein
VHAHQLAGQLQESDPEAAALLRSTAHQTQERQGRVETPHAAYDPMRLYARMARFYRFSNESMDHMHFPTFFGYVREADLMIAEEKAEIDRVWKTPATKSTLAPADAENFLHHEFPSAMNYQGEVIAL